MSLTSRKIKELDELSKKLDGFIHCLYFCLQRTDCCNHLAFGHPMQWTKTADIEQETNSANSMVDQDMEAS